MKVLIGNVRYPRHRFSVRFLFEPRDLWVGVFWNHAEEFLLVYVGLVPAFPICFAWRRS